MEPSSSLDNAPRSKALSLSKQPRLIACRECHRQSRSKLRCDREYPCKSCIKRGCADICPNGILVKPKRHKTTALDSAKLQQTNESLNDRIRLLEEALASSHAQHASEPHPLLTDRLFLSDPQARTRAQKRRLVTENEDSSEVISAYGTLAIGADGQATFHGVAANPDALLESETKGIPSEHIKRCTEATPLPSEVLELARLFPLGTQSYTPQYRAGLKVLIAKYLPLSDKAWDICENWFENGAWLNDPIPRSEFLQLIFNPMYKAGSPDSIAPDHLAVFFILLALGSLLDLRKPFDLVAAEPLYQLSCAAFCLTPIYESATIPSIQTLNLIGVYMFMTNRQNLEYRWLTTGLSSRLMESAGLHRNSETWIRNNPAENQRRSNVFWESYTWDILQSFHTGRSPSLSALHIQCKMPVEMGQSITETASSYSAWKYQYRHRCLMPVMEEAFGARSPSHAAILRLDRKIRDFEVPAMLKMSAHSEMSSHQNIKTDDVPLTLTLQRYAVFCEREMTLLHLHRVYFSHALLDDPANPLGHKHAASVFATYRSASTIVSATQDLSLKEPELVSRIWYVWSNLFSAATVLGNIIIRCPTCQLSSSALVELGVAASLLETRTVHSRSAKVLPVIQQLREKAHEIYKSHNRKMEDDMRRSSSDGAQGSEYPMPTDRSPSDRSVSTTSIASQSGSASPVPHLLTPEVCPPLSLNAGVFHPMEGPSIYNNMSLGECHPRDGDWPRQNASGSESYAGDYGASLPPFNSPLEHYSPWENQGEQYGGPQHSTDYLDHGGYHLQHRDEDGN